MSLQLFETFVMPHHENYNIQLVRIRYVNLRTNQKACIRLNEAETSSKSNAVTGLYTLKKWQHLAVTAVQDRHVTYVVQTTNRK